MLELSYAATTIRRINLGWKRRENPNDMGFPIHPEGTWGKDKQLESSDDASVATPSATKKSRLPRTTRTRC